MRKGFGMFKKVLTLIWLFLFLSSTFAVAAPTVASAQREVDKLRTLAAAKYEAANEATIRIKQLQAETTLLRKKEEGLRKELDASAKFLAQIAIARFKENGLGQGLELLFSADPTKYLSDASTLEVLSRGYSEQLREFEINKQRVEASQLVVSDRTALLKIQQTKLNREVTQAKAALLRAEKILKSLKKEDRERLAAAEAARENKILQESKKYATSYRGDNTRGSIALKYALQQVGDIYVWAAAGPTRWDCSGLTMRAFQKAGVSLPHSSRIQVRYGKSISYGSLKPGDLVFFGKPISHVSIYMGGGKMVQAPRPGKRVEVVAMTKKFGSKPFVAARRL
jgi:cell wall-associated NlpC family hydrolase